MDDTKRDLHMKQEIFIARDGRRLGCSLWDDVAHPRGVVQIIHGMDEYVNRYDRFAKFLNKNGYIVFGDDHRGHGRTAGNATKVGKPDGDTDIFSATVDDEIEILKFLKQKYKLPVLLFGHGYGSFITQRIMENTKLCTAGVCLSGGGRYSLGMLWMGIIVAWVGMKLWGANACARFIEFWSPVRGKLKAAHKLTRDPVQANVRDTSVWRGECFAYGFYYSLFKNLIKLNQDACPETPLLIISGGRDIVNLNGRLAASLYRAYGARDMKNLTFLIYPEAKHDLLLDLDYQDVQNDIVEFFNRAIRK